VKRTVLEDPLLGELTDDALTRDLRVFQRTRGHRFSSDDMATAYVAHQSAPDARTVVDLGCGLGSVLLHLAWSNPSATLVGVEAQAMSFELLRRNVSRNSLDPRVTIHHGDLRDPLVLSQLGTSVDLVTGTPPYFPPDTALDAMDEQRAYARIEYRGGVEAYITTASQLVADDGVFVLCGDSRADPRVIDAASQHALMVRHRCDIIPHEGRPSLFSIWTLTRTPSRPIPQIATITLRDQHGQTTDDARRLKAFSGF
jgi:tRNA1(Val) A37 N6-methylase TrmN6